MEAKVDQLNEQMATLAADAEIRRRKRESIEDLTGDLSRISGGAMEVATRELEALRETADLADTARLLRRFVEAAPTIERLLIGLDQMTAPSTHR